MKEYTPKQIAEMARAFLESDFGVYYMAQMNAQYNVLHQVAEQDTLSSEQKAFKIERAAGLKLAISWLTGRDKMLEEGLLDEPKK